MSITRIAVLGLAIGSAVLAAVLAKGFLGEKPKEKIVKVTDIETSEVLVAAQDIMMGDPTSSGRMKWQKWPKELVKPSMITREARPEVQAELGESRARTAIYEGEPITERKLIVSKDSGFMAAVLPKGMRAIAVEVSIAKGAGGFIRPNDKVDVLLTRRLANDSSGRTITETVISNVRVMAIDQTYNQDNNGEEVAVNSLSTATLEVEPRQAEVLALAEQVGQLTLSLRSLADVGDSALGDDGPRLSPKYAKGGNGEVNVLRYGVSKSTASNE